MLFQYCQGPGFSSPQRFDREAFAALSVGQLFAVRYFPPRAKASIEALVANVMAAYHERIQALDAEELAVQIAHESGIPELTDKHWQVVRFMRDRFLATGNAPSIRALGKESGVPIKELYQLFPKGPAKLAAKIGG